LQDKVFFLGRRDNIPAILSITDLFVFPSEEEGMSNALMEALAAQKIIVCSDIAENIEVVGKAGMYFKNKNISSLYQHIIKALKLTSKEKNAYRNLCSMQIKKFSPQIHLKLFDKYLSRLID
jgi:glycosyltransferase involved in cell wall biosynthesis